MEHNSPVLREGFLVKQGHLVRNWKARWFVLTPDRLLYYKYAGSKRDSCQRGRVMLKDCEVTCPYLEYDSRPLVFKLRTQSSVEHFLEACSREERDAWAAAISSAVEVLRQGGGGANDAQQDDSSSSSSSRWQQQHLQDVNLSQVVDQMYDVHSGSGVFQYLSDGEEEPPDERKIIIIPVPPGPAPPPPSPVVPETGPALTLIPEEGDADGAWRGGREAQFFCCRNAPQI
ncbi:hypothetical protein CRUP_027221 [Coryphaenoides rupestris]|nr:hypothetical protein CRUP_027221 [Coryphaenoides rupestris]